MKKDKIWSYIDQNKTIFLFVLVTIISILIRLLLLNFKSGDYTMFLKQWFDELKRYGGIFALKREIGNYTPIYMTILAILTYLPLKSLISIKLLSIIFDYIGAVAILKISKEILKKHSYKNELSILFYTIYLFLPTVFLNSSCWAQCDSIYTAFILLSIYYLIKEEYKKSVILLSFSFAFKLQAIFILPIFILIYISERKIKLSYFLFIPLTMFITSIPKIIFTKDLFVPFKVYIDQIGTYNNYITLNFPNLYSIFLKNSNSNLINTPFKELSSIACLITLLIFILLAYFVLLKKVKFTPKAIIDFSLLSVLIMTFFLPHMHERYLFLGDSLAVIYLLLNKKNYLIPIGIELISLYGYMYLLFSGFALPISYVSIFYLIIIIIYTKNIIKEYFITS